jgi:hypothetical protein
MPEDGSSEFERATRDRDNASLPREMLAFLGENKKWWLLPILATFLLFGGLLLLSSTAVAPFIYTLF